VTESRGGRRRTRKDLIAGLIFIAFGGLFALGATGFDFGDPVRPGPGFYPLVVGALLVVLGVAITVRSAVEEDEGPVTMPSWRAVILIVGGIVVFALTVRGAGLVPATFLAGLLASLASRTTSPLGSIVMAAGLTALSVLIFVVGLSLRLPLLGTWFPRL
jgi:Tripartite tricarboxylate transporter TctB family